MGGWRGRGRVRCFEIGRILEMMRSRNYVVGVGLRRILELRSCDGTAIDPHAGSIELCVKGDILLFLLQPLR